MLHTLKLLRKTRRVLRRFRRYRNYHQLLTQRLYITQEVLWQERSYAEQNITQEVLHVYTDRSKALLLWFLTVTCSCCPYLHFGSAIMLVTYFVNFR